MRSEELPSTFARTTSDPGNVQTERSTITPAIQNLSEFPKIMAQRTNGWVEINPYRPAFNFVRFNAGDESPADRLDGFFSKL
jgi:hypothetical protein